jgi:hypothetical protein
MPCGIMTGGWQMVIKLKVTAIAEFKVIGTIPRVIGMRLARIGRLFDRATMLAASSFRIILAHPRVNTLILGLTTLPVGVIGSSLVARHTSSLAGT